MICRASIYCNQNCSKHCQITVGDNLVRFLREIDTVESKIGDFASGSGSPLIVSGMQLDPTGNPAYILSDISVSIDISKKFGAAFNKSAMAILNEYIRLVDPPDKNELREKLKNMDSNKILIVPIKTHSNCEVLVPIGRDNKVQETIKNTNVSAIKWESNQKTNTLECSILTDVIEGLVTKRAKIKIEDYGTKLKLTDVERVINSSEADRTLIKMTRFGYIRPIAITDKKKNGIIIDNTYMYLLDGETIKTIAYWEKNTLVGEETFKDIEKSALFKKVKKSLNYIGQHRRFIAPYGLVDCNIVEV